MDSGDNVEIVVNNGYPLNVLVQSDNTIQEIRLYPDDTVVVPNLTTTFIPDDNSMTEYYFKWKDINNIFHTSSSLIVTTQVFNSQFLINEANNNYAPISLPVNDIDLSISNINNTVLVDANNKFCQIRKFQLNYASTITITTTSQDINNIIVTIYNDTLTTTYASNVVLQPGTYYVIVSNGDNTIPGGTVNLHFVIEKAIPEPFASATLVTISPDSTHHFSGSIALTSKTFNSDNVLCSAYKVNIDRCCSIQSSQLTFSGIETLDNVCINIFTIDDKNNILFVGNQDNDVNIDTIILSGTYYIVFSISDNDNVLNNCVGNFTFNLTEAGNIQQGTDTLTVDSQSTELYMYRQQVFTNVLTKAFPTSTAKLYPNHIDFTTNDSLMGSAGSYDYFAVITSADGITKNITNVINLITSEPDIIFDYTNAVVDPNTYEATINSVFEVTNEDGYTIPNTSSAIVTIKNNTTNTVLGTVPLTVANNFTNTFMITASSTGQEIGFYIIVSKFTGDNSITSTGTTVTL